MTQTTDAALVERGKSLVVDFKAADWCDCYPQGAALAEYALAAADTIEAQARRIEALEGEARHASDLLLTLCRVTKHRTIDPSVPLAKNMLDTAERLAALSPDPTP